MILTWVLQLSDDAGAVPLLVRATAEQAACSEALRALLVLARPDGLSTSRVISSLSVCGLLTTG
jgi:hypothetical protein